MNTTLTKTKSDFSYTKVKKDGILVIAIVDLNLGGTSVTNDIENVVEAICNKEKISPDDAAFIYMDNLKTWDGWNPKTGWHIALSTVDKKVAINKIVKFKQEQK
jgi:hypothetical protein